ALLPGLVVVGTEREVLGLSAADGARVWALPARGRSLLSAAADADELALLLLDRRGRRSIIVYDRPARGTPRERGRVTSSAALGTPALLWRTLLVPWGPGYVSAVDARARRELGRARLGGELLHALWSGGALFFGGPPWVELTGGGAPPLTLPRRPLPGLASGVAEPNASSPGLDVARQAAIGADVARLYVQPLAPKGTPAAEHYMASYGPVVLGFGRELGALVWVKALPGRALAAALIGDVLVVCDASGGVRALSSATGHVLRAWQLERQRRITLGEPTLSACALAPGA